ncbi:DNA polymerase III subunit gamma/tau [Porticoccus hydrocarbonoclasticus]|uniref:DNA polymerase III subunit gamma/tau n=1 Tax=Porticoccus hydrocarbonoclasticus TaxID=1073414 RepID=UPI00056C150E|nr:DNA polymerase III subunit gamma/tau [Porticoccus hydrocarbonoclasticus]
MSYQVLARKWRPRNFSEMVGQEHVLRALINALDNNRLHHAYLFTGTRGVGKTTIARILAKCLNCDTGISSNPCGTCSACVSIAENRFVDLIEVDAASRTKVEDTRELLDNVQYAPTAGRFKVYLIDEVHMLSGHSFNALLKTLEEPPPHVKFLLATTDPQKLPVTILSRCLQFNLKHLSPERIVEHLQFVLGEEKVPCEEAGLWALARSADGSMRDALSLTDQAIAHGGGKITEAEVYDMLGTIDLGAIADIARALANGDAVDLLAVVGRMAEHAPDFGVALADLLSVWHRVAIAQTVPDALDNRHGDDPLVRELAKALSPEDVQLFYQIALLGRRDLPLAPEPRIGFEMALLRMLAFQPVADSAVHPPPAPAGLSNVSVAPTAEGAEESPKKSLSSDRDSTLSATVRAGSVETFKPAVDRSSVESVPEIEVAPEAAERANPPMAVNALPLAEVVPDRWIEIYQGLQVAGLLQNIAANLCLVDIDGPVLHFVLDIASSSLYEESHQQRLADVLTEYFGEPVTVQIEVGAVATETPLARTERLRRERQSQAVEQLRLDPNVRRITELFNGVLLENTIKPID